MLNSLRLLGHAEPLYVMDCGLTTRQRDMLAPHASVVTAPRQAPPYLSKTILPLQHPAEVVVLIDADVIVTRALTKLIDQARGGKVIAFRTIYDRFFPEWGDLLGLGPARRQPYVCSAVVFLGGQEGHEVLRLMDEGQAQVPPPTRLPPDPSRFFSTVAHSPLQLADQDVLNAVLSTRPEPERFVALEHGLAPEPPFAGLRPVGEDGIRYAAGDGTEPYLLHHLGAKPWLVPMRDSPYSRLLSRMLLEQGLEVGVPEGDVPVRLRRGPRAAVSRALASLRDGFRSRVREPLAWRLRRRRDGLQDGATPSPGAAEEPG